MELVGDVGHVESHFFRLETVLVSVQDRCMVCGRSTIGSEIVLAHPMVLLGDEAQVEASFGPLGDSAHIEARLVHGLHQTYHRVRYGLERTR